MVQAIEGLGIIKEVLDDSSKMLSNTKTYSSLIGSHFSDENEITRYIEDLELFSDEFQNELAKLESYLNKSIDKFKEQEDSYYLGMVELLHYKNPQVLGDEFIAAKKNIYGENSLLTIPYLLLVYHQLTVFEIDYYLYFSASFAFYYMNLGAFLSQCSSESVLNIDPKIFQSFVSGNNKEAAKTRWDMLKKATPKLKKQFLEIMDKNNFSSFDDCAYVIYSNIEPTDPKTGKKLSVRWIRDRLSEAQRGDFS